MTNNNHGDWAWPALIQSLQQDITHLRELMDDVRRESSNAREQHRQELNHMIEQLRDLRDKLHPIVKEREDTQKLARQTRWAWIERFGWILMGGIALSVWHYISKHLSEP